MSEETLPEPETRKVRLVIAEDETMTRELLARLIGLEDDITVVGTASDGAKALSVVLAQKPDVLLTDIGMPQMNGIQLTETLRREMPQVGVVILTIYNDDERVFAAIKAGARGYVLKDSPPQETIAAVRAAGRGEALLHPSLVGRLLAEFGRLSVQRAADNSVFAELTDREREVLTEIGRGKRNKEIADTLFISEKTVKNHISNIFAKLEVNTRAEAALLAARQGLV
ncbi:MAG: response regulator transcription factor [Capsulimonadales bacterium]|nr:response regulator transcription factor [Capsulimonadales bacterium]